MHRVIFRTVHGSRLYGLANDNSDEDYYAVISKPIREYRFGRQYKTKYAKHRIVDKQDTLVLDLGTWVEQCKAGVPQALEAMFSQMATHDEIPYFRNSFRVGTQAFETYYRTIKSFALAEDDTIKRRRHALRLALNLQEMAKTGRFNPTLSPEDARYVTDFAHKSHNDVYGLALSISW